MRIASIWLLTISCFCAPALADTTGDAQSNGIFSLRHFYRFVSIAPESQEAIQKLVCPELIGIVLKQDPRAGVVSAQVRPFDPATREDRSFANQGIWDPEQPYQYYSWLFLNLNGPAKKWTYWEQGNSDGFSRPAPNYWLRNETVSLSATFRQIDSDTVRLVQRQTTTPYTLGLVRHGRVRVSESVVSRHQNAGGATLTLSKVVDNQTVRTCTYRQQ